MGKAGKIVRLVRVMRIMRIFKLVRHFAGLQSLIYTLNQVREGQSGGCQDIRKSVTYFTNFKLDHHIQYSEYRTGILSLCCRRTVRALFEI